MDRNRHTGPQDEEVCGRIEPLGGWRAVNDGGRRTAGDVGAPVPALSGSLRGGRARRSDRPAGWQAVAQAGSCGGCRTDAGAVRGSVPGLEREAFPRVSGARSRLPVGLHLGETQLHTAGLVERAKRRGAHRRKRERKPFEGMMLHQDGSRALWLAGRPALDLIVTMDDATSTIYSAFLIEEEGTASTFRALLEVFTAHGLPSSLYTDRGSHYFYTPEADGPVDKDRLTQVGRALKHLGVEHIPAYSPEARGRSERMFATL